MRNKTSYLKLTEDFKKQYIDSGIINVPMEVVDIIIKSYLDAKSNALKNGDIVIEPIGESRITIRKTNSSSNNGLSSKIVTVLDKSLNSEICEKANSDVSYLNSLKCDSV